MVSTRSLYLITISPVPVSKVRSAAISARECFSGAIIPSGFPGPYFISAPIRSPFSISSGANFPLPLLVYRFGSSSGIARNLITKFRRGTDSPIAGGVSFPFSAKMVIVPIPPASTLPVSNNANIAFFPFFTWCPSLTVIFSIRDASWQISPHSYGLPVSDLQLLIWYINSLFSCKRLQP